MYVIIARRPYSNISHLWDDQYWTIEVREAIHYSSKEEAKKKIHKKKLFARVHENGFMLKIGKIENGPLMEYLSSEEELSEDEYFYLHLKFPK